jgi:hypothetical protein
LDSFVILAVIAVAAAIAWYVRRLERERRVALEYLAAELDVSFDPRPDGSLHRRYPHSVFSRGRRRSGRNTLSGSVILGGRPFYLRMGDYRYTTGSGKNARTHRLSYAVLRVPWIDTPNLLIRPEGIADKIGSGLGFDDIDFESEEFSRAFWVKGPDRKFAYDVVHPRMMRFLLDGPRPHLEIVDDACLLLDGTSRWDPAEFRGWLSWAGAFFELWPEHVTTRFQERSDLRGIA